MASLNKKMVLTSVFAVVATLSACGKPEIRSKTMDSPTVPTSPSTSPNPKVAEAENKAADVKTMLAAKTDPAAAKAAEIAAARRQAALDELADLLKREGAGAQQIADAKAKVIQAGGTVPADVPPAGATGNVPPIADSSQNLLFEQAAHRTFAIAMIEPVMRANFQVFLARNEVLRLQNLVEVQKKELSPEDQAKLQKFRLDYGLGDDKTGFDPLLERVDGVNLSFLAAPLALRSNWAIDAEVQADKITSRILEMNTSTSVDRVAYRAARLALKSGQQTEESLSLMKAFLGFTERSKNPMTDKILDAVTEITTFTVEPVYLAEIERVRALLLDEYKKNEAAKAVSIEPVKK